MPSLKTVFNIVEMSLSDLLGEDYAAAVYGARAFLTGEDERGLMALAAQPVNLYPAAFYERLLSLLPHVGTPCCGRLDISARGATTTAFATSAKRSQAPLSAMGFFRVGEDGRLCLITKCEHYHTLLGHAFPGYALIEHARRLGIPNATHNNTRGHITRLAEEELVHAAAGLARDDRAAWAALMASEQPTDLNRVLNLETGSLAAEAAVKLALSRFYRCQEGSQEPAYASRTPVLVVMGDDDGGIEANYHGTTVLTQIMRGMWPGLAGMLEQQGGPLVRCVRPNDLEGLEALFRTYEESPYKIAALFHELVMMNYGGKRLDDAFVQRMYALCAAHDVPAVVDEIQTGLWSPELFMFREYGVRPSMVAVGKGFPGGECPASRLLFSATFDHLPQFGALVTNGQEELASLAYLISMRWAEANASITRAVGDYFLECLDGLAQTHRRHILAIEGKRHLAGIHFRELGPAKAFVAHLGEAGLDISVQTYKTGCPPSPLVKLPITAGYEVVDFVIERMDETLRRIDTAGTFDAS